MMSTDEQPASGVESTARDAAERELVAAVAAALAAATLPGAGARPAARTNASAWRLAGRRRVLRQWHRRV